jgi:hypothetical protein
MPLQPTSGVDILAVRESSERRSRLSGLALCGVG